jgi:hypothetical protein
MNDYIAVSLANLSWSYFVEKEYKLAGTHLEQSLEYWSKVTTRFEYPFLWLSHLHAIALCGVNDDFADKHINQVATFATILRDKRQVPLPQSIDQLLRQLSDSSNLSRRASLIKELTKTAAEHRLI